MELWLEDTPTLIEAQPQPQKDVAAKPRPRNEFQERCQNFFNEKVFFRSILKNNSCGGWCEKKKKDEFHELIMLEFF